MRRPDSALDQMRNTTSTHPNHPGPSSRTPSGTIPTSTTTGNSPTAPRSAHPYAHHSPTTPFRSPTEHVQYGQQPQDFFNLPPPQQQHRPSYGDPSGPQSPHTQYSPTERRLSDSSMWGPQQQGQQRYPSLRGDHLLDSNPPGPELQKRTSALMGLSGSSSQPMPPPGQSQYYMQSPQSEEPGRIVYRGGDVGVMPQFPTGGQSGPTYGSSFPHYMSSMAPPPLTTRGSQGTPPKPASPTKPGEVKGEPKRTPPSPPQQPPPKRSKTDEDGGHWQASEASPTDSENKRAMAGMQNTVKTRPVALLSSEQKKANHIHSEQKRRATIRKGYEALCEVVPTLREVVAAGGPGVGAVTTKVPGMSPGESEKKSKSKGKGKNKGDDDGGLGGVVKSEALVLTKTIDHVEALLTERNKLLTEHAHLVAALPPHERPPPYHPDQTTSLQPGATARRIWETPWGGGTGMPPEHMRDGMHWMKGLPGDEDDDDDDGDDD